MLVWTSGWYAVDFLMSQFASHEAAMAPYPCGYETHTEQGKDTQALEPRALTAAQELGSHCPSLPCNHVRQQQLNYFSSQTLLYFFSQTLLYFSSQTQL